MNLSESICTNIQQIIVQNLNEILSLRSRKWLKADGSYVSEGDLLCEKLILDYLATLDENVYVLSEETFTSEYSFDKYRFVLVLDPIDGTENFVSGLKEWGVGISIYQNEIHMFSMIGLPELNIWLKTKDKIAKYKSRIYGLSSSLSKEDLDKIEEGFEYRIIGCCMYNMYSVISGSFSVFQNPKGAHCWDILPGLNLALENNCLVSVENRVYHGEFLHPNKRYRFRIEHQ